MGAVGSSACFFSMFIIAAVRAEEEIDPERMDARSTPGLVAISGYVVVVHEDVAGVYVWTADDRR